MKKRLYTADGKKTDTYIDDGEKANRKVVRQECEIPEETYAYNLRMSGIMYFHLKERAYQRRTSIGGLLNEMVLKDMEDHPEIIEGLKKINPYLRGGTL